MGQARTDWADLRANNYKAAEMRGRRALLPTDRKNQKYGNFALRLGHFTFGGGEPRENFRLKIAKLGQFQPRVGSWLGFPSFDLRQPQFCFRAGSEGRRTTVFGLRKGRTDEELSDDLGHLPFRRPKKTWARGIYRIALPVWPAGTYSK